MAEPVAARRSASVILVRDGPTGVETFMVRRHARSPAFPSAYVFPGGTVRPDDAELRVDEPLTLSEALSARSDEAVDPPRAASLYVCAIRELFEEAGVLCVRDPSSAVLEVDDTDRGLQERLATARLALQSGQLTLSGVLLEWGWMPAFDLLVPFSHWVTPSMLAARFDTWFFVAAMPHRQAALHDTIETSEGLWLRPATVLEGDYETVYATAQHLQRLTAFQTVADVLAFSSQKPIRRVQPTMGESASGVHVSIAPQLRDVW